MTQPLEDFPRVHGLEREEKIIQCIREGRYEHEWAEITIENDQDIATFYVSADALKIDGVRVNVTASTQQKIADLLCAVMPTGKILDHIWHECLTRLYPHTMPISSSTEDMIKHSIAIDEDIAKHAEPDYPLCTVGKTWIIDNSLAVKPHGTACNYGYHYGSSEKYKGIKGNVGVALLKDPITKMYWRLIQSRGWHHDINHVDYSQVCILVKRDCIVNGSKVDINDLFVSPTLSKLACHDGVLKVVRQPGVERLQPLPPVPPESSQDDVEVNFKDTPSDEPKSERGSVVGNEGIVHDAAIDIVKPVRINQTFFSMIVTFLWWIVSSIVGKR